MFIKLLSELLLKNDDSFTWLSLTNNEIGIPIPELTQALLQNLTVRKVSCHAGFLGSLAVNDFELLLQTFSQLSHLRDLWLALPAKQAWRSSGVLNTILGSPKMSGLQKLTLRGTDDNGCLVVAHELKKPSCSLTDLQIRGATTLTSGTGNAPVSKMTRRGILAIAEMLHVNKSLERLDLCYKGLDTQGFEALAKALVANQKLQKLELSIPATNAAKKQDWTKGYDALAQHMRQNYTLNYLNTPAEGDSKALMDLLTKLNRTGVRALMRNAADHTGLEEVLEVLQAHTKDVSAVFEILVTNPALWDPLRASAEGLAASSLEDTVKENPNHALLNSADCCAWKKQKLKPVMARWNENIFSSQEREKIKNFKRWTPIIVDSPPAADETAVKTRSKLPRRASTPATLPMVLSRRRRSAVADSLVETIAALECATSKESEDKLLAIVSDPDLVHPRKPGINIARMTNSGDEGVAHSAAYITEVTGVDTKETSTNPGFQGNQINSASLPSRALLAVTGAVAGVAVGVAAWLLSFATGEQHR
jgi:hypothetical protein